MDENYIISEKRIPVNKVMTLFILFITEYFSGSIIAIEYWSITLNPKTCIFILYIFDEEYMEISYIYMLSDHAILVN